MNDKQKFLKVAIEANINQLFDYLPNENSFSIKRISFFEEEKDPGYLRNLIQFRHPSI